MNPEQYEHHVAAVLEGEGWVAEVTSYANDFGLDVVATKGTQRLGVQAKMYGGTRTRVNAEQIMCLYGAGAYADCGRTMLATDGELTPGAHAVAIKLGVEIRQLARHTEPVPSADPSFGNLWQAHVVPLAGQTLKRSNGKTMQIVEVDGSGVRRITTGGTPQRIDIDIFRWTLERLLAGKTVTRTEIHERNPRQVSSGVMLILTTAIPAVETIRVGRGTGLTMTARA